MSILEKFCSQTHLTFTKELARRDAGSFQSHPFVECLNAVKNNKQFFNYAMFIIRLAKMNQILHCDWLPERVRLSYLARSGLPTVSRKDNFPESHIINPLLTKLVRSRRLNISLVLFFCVIMTSTPSRSINTQKGTWPISSHLDLTLGQ